VPWVETTDQRPRALRIARHTRTVVAGMSIWSTLSAELVYRGRQFGEGNVAWWQIVGALQGVVCKPLKAAVAPNT
jgi:hypothetical protein